MVNLKERNMKQLKRAKEDFERTLKANEAKIKSPFNAIGMVEAHRIEQDNTILRNELEKINEAIQEKEKEIEAIWEDAKELANGYDKMLDDLNVFLDKEQEKLKEKLKKKVESLETEREKIKTVYRDLAGETGGTERSVIDSYSQIRVKLEEFKNILIDLR